MSFEEFAVAPESSLERVRAAAFAMLTPRTAASTHLGLVPRIYPEGHTLRLVDREIRVPVNSILVFEDQLPGANFGHPCRYHFHSPLSGSRLSVEDASFPPYVADSGAVTADFHAPLGISERRPIVYGRPPWIPHVPYPWLLDDNRFALLFTSQISNRRHVEDIELAYRVLHHHAGFNADNIYVLCYDGTIGATDASASDMSSWVGDGTAYKMAVSGPATKEKLQSTLAIISERMNSDSLLFIHTNNHGSHSGLCVDNASVVTPSEWGTMLGGMNKFGSLVVTMEQCYSGAFLEPTLDNSQAKATSFASAVTADKPSMGASHFDPWAQTWFEGISGATAYGAPLAHQPDKDSNGRVSVREAFDYSLGYDPASDDDPQYGERPADCGLHIYLTKPPTFADILREIVKKYLAIDEHLIKHPIPDPAPDWASELLKTLDTAEALEARLGARAQEMRV